MNSFRMSAFAAIAFSAFFIVHVHAAPIIYNTGVDANGVVLPDGSFDPHYVGFTPIVDSQVSATPPTDTISAWIRPSTNLGPGSYTFETNFTMPSAGPVTITGQWAAYASGVDMRINGVSGGNTTPNPGYTAWNPFTITGTAVAGNNTFDISVGEAFGNPTVGLRLEIFSVVPEPTAPLLLGLGATLLCRRRSKR